MGAAAGPRTVPPRAVDPWPNLVDALDLARCAVASAIAGGADRRWLVEMVSRALVDIRGLVWPGAAAVRLPSEPDAVAA